MVIINPSYLGRISNANKRISEMNVRGNLAAIATVGAASGLAKTALDDIDDDITTMVPNVAAGAGMAVAGAYGVKAAAEFIEGGDETQILRKEMKRTGAEIESTKVSKDLEGKNINASTLSESDMKKMETFKKVNKVGRGIGAVGALAVGAATVLDIGQGINEKRRVEDMKKEQEKSLRRKQKQEDEYKRSQGYGHTDLGGIVFDMFEERLGHHKIGNARFQ